LLKSTAGDEYATSSSRDGRFLLYTAKDPETKSDLWVLPLQGDRKPISFLRTKFNEGSGQFSPDGRWLAYSSTDSGTEEVYVTHFPTGEGRWQVSQAGGTEPRWRRDGKEMFYINSKGVMTAVAIAANGAFSSGAPRE
jgi:Tol biopolymer transport system component